MAVLKMVAVFDRAMSLFNRPFFVVSLGQAIRSFEDEVNRPAEDNPMFKHSKDFALFHVGEYEEESGRAVALDVPVRLCEATDCQSRQIYGGQHATPEAPPAQQEVGFASVSGSRQDD